MKTNILLFSPTGTSARIVKTIAHKIDKKYKEYDFTYPKIRTHLKRIHFSENELLLVSIPVYSGRIPIFLKDFFAGIKGNNTPFVPIVVYGNRDYDDALLELKELFEKKGFKSIAAAAFIGEHSYSAKVARNRPDSKDLKIAAEFGKNIKERLNDSDKISDFKVKGNYPYKERKNAPKIAPVTNDNCDECGICSEMCPMDAIDMQNLKVADSEKCIKCCSCIKLCPQNAKAFNDEFIINVTNYLEDSCSEVRKEPEIFGL